MKNIESFLSSLKADQRLVRSATTLNKNTLLLKLADLLVSHQSEILKANQKDLKSLDRDFAKRNNSAFRDRLALDEKRISLMAESLREVAALPDPVHEVVESFTLANGLKIKRERAPLGLIFMIFESRPNVILEAFSLAWKAGNSIILRGGSESKHSAQMIYHLMNEAQKKCGISYRIFHGIEDYDRGLVKKLLKQKKWIDVVVPRGGDKLIEFVQNESHMPIIKNDRGLCHVYVDEMADIEMAANIVINAKTSRPGVCNSLETLVLHEHVAQATLDHIVTKLKTATLEWRADARAYKWLKLIVPTTQKLKKAQSKDWDTEYLDLILNCIVVKNIDEALAHIEKYGSRHSEAIVTKSETNARRFQMEVDAAAVYWNASTRFTDGFEFGLGGELGISTQKLHTRGPVGLRELTTPRWIIDGQGQIR